MRPKPERSMSIARLLAVPLALAMLAASPVAAASFADLATLSIAAPVVLRATIFKAERLKPRDAPDVAPGNARMLVAAATTSAIVAPGEVPPRITYLVDVRGIEVHAVRPLRRIGPDGQLLSQLVVEITQSLHTTDGRDLTYRGGATLIIDLNRGQASYMVRKRVDQVARVSRQQALWSQVDDINSDNYTGWGWSGSEPFALLHKHHREAT